MNAVHCLLPPRSLRLHHLVSGSSDLSLDEGGAGLTRNLNAAVRRQLDTSWHTLPWGARQRVLDLSTVQALATMLLEVDAVTFLG